MTDDEFIKAMQLSSVLPPITPPKDPHATKEQERTNEAD